jgi:hypothetical protein
MIESQSETFQGRTVHVLSVSSVYGKCFVMVTFNVLPKPLFGAQLILAAFNRQHHQHVHSAEYLLLKGYPAYIDYGLIRTAASPRLMRPLRSVVSGSGSRPVSPSNCALHATRLLNGSQRTQRAPYNY